MSFQPQTYAEILAFLVAQVRASTDLLTDFNIGGVTRSWLEASAIGLDELWMGTAHGIADAIPEAIYLAFGFERLPAAYALGELTFYRTILSPEVTPIPAGTVVRALGSSIEYVTVESGIIPAGAYEVTVLARATQPGPGTHVAAGTLTVLPTLAWSGVSVTNRAPIVNGRNEETDVERQARFAHYIETLARATGSALSYAARLAMLRDDAGAIREQARHVALREVPGTVDLYVHNGVGSTSPELVAAVARLVEGSADWTTGAIVPGWRAAGVEVRYHAMTDRPLHVVATLTLAAGSHADATIQAMRATLDALIRAFQGTVLTVPQLLTALYAVPGVQDLILEAPLSEITYAITERPVYGSLTVHV